MEKLWREDNYIRKFKEASEDRNYLRDLKKLINAEAIAAVQYKIAAESITGNHQSYLVNHFTEHVDEEWDHYSQLVAALMQRAGEAEMNLIAINKEALPETEELTSFDSEYLRDFFIRAEQNAIKAYQEFYDKIENSDKDLADIIIKITQDEKNHKLDFTRMESKKHSEEENADYENFEIPEE